MSGKRFLCAAGLGFVCLAEAADAEWEALLAASLEDKPRWEHFGEARLFAGYRDNVLLSSFAREESPYLGMALDASAWRPLGSRNQLQGLFSGEHRHYLDAEGVDFEQTFLGSAEFSRDWGRDWASDTTLEYVYLDQVVDVSATEAEPIRARIRGHSLGFRPAIERRTGAGLFALKLAGQRHFYEEPLDDYWEFAPEGSWTWPTGRNTEWILSYRFAYDWYDTNLALDANGNPLVPVTKREMRQHEPGLYLRQYWGANRQWRLALRVTGRINQDNGGGYYDYVRPLCSIRLRYRKAGWEVEGGARFAHYDYQTQTVSDTNPTERRRSELRCELRGRRHLTRALYAFVEYSREETFANRPEEEYQVNSVAAGISLEF